MKIDQSTVTAPELYGYHWLNGEPRSIYGLRGSVILLYFWEYCCIKSIRMLPYVSELLERYRQSGLIVIGIHVPSYAFNRSPESVEPELRSREIDFPVVLDNDRSIAEAYRIEEIPSIILIDGAGNIRLRLSGRGKQNILERHIQQSLYESGNREDYPLPMEAFRPEEFPGVRCDRETPQILFGYGKGFLGNKEGFNPESTYAFEDPGYYLQGRYYLNGIWQSGRNSMTVENREESRGYIVVQYEAREVFGVIGRSGNQAVHLEITQDGVCLTEANRGEDVSITPGGTSMIIPGEPRLMNLVQNGESSEHILKISSIFGDAEFFSLTFIPGVMPELLSRN